MVQLTDFELHKLYGLIYQLNEMFFEAMEEYDKAIEIKDDPQIYYRYAQCYAGLKQYYEAKEYAMISIEKGYSGYALYAQLCYSSTKDYEEMKKVFESGVEKKDASACFELYRLQCSEIGTSEISLLDKSVEFATPLDKSFFALNAAIAYRNMTENFKEAIPDFEIEDKSIHYIELAQQYGLESNYSFNVFLFNFGSKNKDYPLIEKILEKLDIDAKRICLFILMEKLWVEKKESNPLKDKMISLFIDALIKENEIIATMIKAYQSDTTIRAFKKLMNKYNQEKIYIPIHFQKAFKLFIDAFSAMLEEGTVPDSDFEYGEEDEMTRYMKYTI